MLKNPAYAGSFVFGRSGLNRASEINGRPLRTPLPIPDWRIVVKDKYPGYVSWEIFEKIQAMLSDNRADYMRLPGLAASSPQPDH